MVGQWLAINAPERIERLILLCTSAYLPPAAAWHERAAAVREAGTPEVVADAVRRPLVHAGLRRRRTPRSSRATGR